MNRPILLLGSLIVAVALVGGGIALLRSEPAPAAPSADLVAPSAGADPELALPTAAAAPKQVKINSLTPQEREKERRLRRALNELERIKQVGEPYGDMYKIIEGGQEVYYGGELAAGIGRNGEPLYATVKAHKVPVGEMRERREVPAPKVKRIDGSITSLPNVKVPSGVSPDWKNQQPTLDVEIQGGDTGQGAKGGDQNKSKPKDG